MKILIVDDSKELRSRLRNIIPKIRDFNTIFEAESTQSALKIINENSLDIVILDIAMPGSGGLFVLEHIKIRNPQITVFMFTNYSSTVLKKMSIALGADYFFSKSDFQDMVVVLEQHKLCLNKRLCS